MRRSGEQLRCAGAIPRRVRPRGYRFQRPPAERSEAPPSEARPSRRAKRGSAERSEAARRSSGGRHYKLKLKKVPPESPGEPLIFFFSLGKWQYKWHILYYSTIPKESKGVNQIGEEMSTALTINLRLATHDILCDDKAKLDIFNFLTIAINNRVDIMFAKHLGLLSRCYLNGWGTPFNSDRAIVFALMSVEYCNPWGCFVIASSYMSGIFSPKNFIEAAFWFQRSIDCGLRRGCYNLALLLDKGGLGLVKDERRAVDLLKIAVQDNWPAAIFTLALHFLNGRGTEKNLPLAVVLFERAANAGYIKAWNNLAQLYDSGVGVDQDIDEAVRLYQ